MTLQLIKDNQQEESGRKIIGKHNPELLGKKKHRDPVGKKLYQDQSDKPSFRLFRKPEPGSESPGRESGQAGGNQGRCPQDAVAGSCGIRKEAVNGSAGKRRQAYGSEEQNKPRPERGLWIAVAIDESGKQYAFQRE